ncbi:hypothetical protein ACE7GA_08015 [Roseomonas sp. CCTCC AB2023176]|uniref:hypothetical protein n=1 Tax=Roseomonas sp. CCTCC AB2023176 TaxID=3342640 RepID=UPI0035DD16DB
MTNDEDVVIMGDAIRIQGATLEQHERLAAMLRVAPEEASRIAVSEALADMRTR